MRRILLCIPPALAFVALQASCEDTNGGSGDGGQFVFDSGPFTPPPPPPGTPPPPPTDSGVDAGPQLVTVLVTAPGKQPKAGIEVVAHDATGAVLTTQTTDAMGKAIFFPAPAMVSAMLGSPTGIGGHQIITWMGVEPGDVLATGDVELFAAQVGQYAVDQTGALDGGTSYTAQLGSCSGFYGGAFPITLPVTADCLRATNSILLSGVDTTLSTIGYAFKRDAGAPLADGGSTPVTMGAWAAPGSTKVIAPSLDLGNGYASVQLWEIADGNGYPNPSGQTTTDSGTDFLTPTGFSDALQADVRYHPNTAQFSTQSISKRAAASATVTVDFASPLPLVTGATEDNSNAQHPKVTITTASSLASADGGVIMASWRGPGAEFSDQWLFVVPPSTTSVTAPSMPADATAWLPNADAAATIYNEPKILFAESDLIPSYKEFRAGVALLLPYSSGFVGSTPETRVVLPAAGTLRTTTYFFQNNL